jgi:hypothetical protein
LGTTKGAAPSITICTATSRIVQVLPTTTTTTCSPQSSILPNHDLRFVINMPSLTELPTELRQQILLLALPETNRVELAVPTQFIQLFHINQCLRHDMKAITPIWTPIHYISHPSTLTSRAPRTRGWNCSRVCLDLFYTSFLGRIVHRHQDPSRHSHPELLIDWINAVPFLPEDVDEVWLDVTPAPVDKREPHPTWRECGPPWFDLFIHSDFAAMRFLGAHVEDVAVLVKTIDQHYGGRVRINLSGRLSEKSAYFVESVSLSADRKLEFVGTWVSNEDAFVAFMSSKFSCPMMQATGRCGTHALAWLGTVGWSRETGNMYAELVNEVSEWLLVGDVKQIAKLRNVVDAVESGTERMVVLPPAGGLRRSFQHRVAADLGLTTVEAGERHDRHVVVRP